MSSSSGSEKGRDRNGVRGNTGGRQGEEIATKTLVIQSKRFYLDVKQNDRGRFVKLAEVAINGRKNRLFMSMRVSKNIKDLLGKFEEHVAKNTESKNDSGIIHTETIINDKRRYYLDLRENQRGPFLRVTQCEIQTGQRNSVAVPSQGIGQLHDALEQLIDEYGEGFIDEDVDLPDSQTFRSDGKHFFFDPSHNNRGDFLKITELKPSIGVRNTIALSVKAIPQFTNALNKIYEDFQTIRAAEAAAAKDEGGGGDNPKNKNAVAAAADSKAPAEVDKGTGAKAADTEDSTAPAANSSTSIKKDSQQEVVAEK